MSGSAMVEKLQRYREHAATLVLGVVALTVVAAIVRVVLHSQTLGVRGAFLAEGSGFMGLVSVLLVILTAGACTVTRPPTVHARLIALLAFVLVSAGTVLSLVFLGFSLAARQGNGFLVFLEGVGGITDLLLKLGACALLWLLLQRAPRPVVSGTTDQLPEPEQAPALPATTAPVTPRDAAAGAVWTTAGEAARGGQARWGSAAKGWTPDGVVEAEPQALPAGRADSLAARAEASQQVVVPVDDAAFNGPAAKASPDLWRR